MRSADYYCDRHKDSNAEAGTVDVDMTPECEARFQAAIAMAQLSYELPNVEEGEQVRMQPPRPERDSGWANVPGNSTCPLGEDAKTGKMLQTVENNSTR